MNRVFSLLMYVLWIAAIVFTLAATFNDFKYEDLNVIAAALFVFAVVNSVLAVKVGRG